MAKGRIDWAKKVGRRLKLRDLHVFLTAADRGSMAKAAIELGVSQPVVSAAIADLESVVGARLLDRTPQGVQPTPFGRALMRGGTVAFDGLQQTIKEIDFLSDPTAGEVRIGCPETVSALLPGICERFRRRHQKVRFQVLDMVAPTLDLPSLRNRHIDLAIVRVFWAPPHPEDLAVEELFDDETVVVVGKDNFLARRRKVTLADLASAEWILPPPNTTNSVVVMEGFRKLGLPEPKVSFVTFSVTLRTNLLRDGRYVSVLPRSMMTGLAANETALKMLPITLPRRKWPTVLVTLRGRTLNPIAQKFIDHLRIETKALHVAT